MIDVKLDLKKFNIIQMNTNSYRMQKLCSVTKQMYSVYLTNMEFRKYHTRKGKYVGHLDHLEEEQRIFLQTTCTPEEVKTLTPVEKKLSKKEWKYRLGLKDKSK